MSNILLRTVDRMPRLKARLRKHLFEAEKPHCNVRHVYTYTDSLGRNWHTFGNPLQMPWRRMLAAEAAMRFAECNITRKNMLHLLEKARQAANSGHFTEAFSLLHELEQRAQLLAEEASLTGLALVYALAEGEPPDSCSPEWQRRKQEWFEADPDLRGFFLQWAYDNTLRAPDSLPTDIPTYLQATQALMPRLCGGSGMPASGSTASTT